jgi:hypothetical protein
MKATASTGVLLIGEKGAGNTMLSKNISSNLANNGIPTIVINEPWRGDNFNKLIQSIEQPCVILFDEFEKVYKKDEQKSILTLLDGVYPTKKLFIFTSNDVYNIDDHLFNRPGRIYYNIQFTGIEDEFIREYCMDNLIDTSYIDQICKISVLFAAFNFDLLQALVEEMNRYNESPQDALKILNAIPEDNEKNKFNVTITVNGIEYAENVIEDRGTWYGNPLSPKGLSIGYRKPNENDTDWDWEYVTMNSTDLKNIDINTGVFVNKLGTVITLTRERFKIFSFNGF